MQNNKLLSLERISYCRNRKENMLHLDGNEKADIWDRKHFDLIYSNIKDYEFGYYPDDSFDFLHKKICKHYNIKKDNFIEGLGSDYLIRDFLLLHNDQNKQKNIITMDLGYGMYNVYPKGLNYKISHFDYKIDISSVEIYTTNKEKMYQQISDQDIVIITNPNQISNYDFSYENINELCEIHKDKVFLIDEAYYGYGSFTALELIKKHKNIFILRSFSKEFGLAALRFGLLFGHHESMKYIKNIASIYNTSIFTARTIEYFLDNYHLIEEYNKNVIIGREYISLELKRRGYKVWSTNTMSIFVFFNNEKETDETYDKLNNNNICTKKYSSINSVRITCAPKYIMQKVIDVFDYNYDYFIDCYKNDGYFLIHNLFDNNEIFEINNIYNLEKDKDCYEKNIYNGKILRLEKFVKNNKEIYNKINNKLSPILNKILGKNYQIFKDKIIEKYPNNINNFNLHMDGIFKTFNYRLKKETLGWWTYSKLFANVNIMLTDNTIENGALCIAKNNFNQNLDDLNYIIDNNIVDKESAYIIKDVDKIKKNTKCAVGNKGSILVFNPLCPHFSSSNKSNVLRRNIYLSYCSDSGVENIYNLFNDDKELVISNVGRNKYEDELLNESHLKKTNL